MKSTLVKIRPKGQVTLPVEMLRELGWNEGEQLALVKRGETLVFERPETLVARGYGMFSRSSSPVDPTRTTEEILEEQNETIGRAVVAEYEARVARIEAERKEAVGAARD